MSSLTKFLTLNTNSLEPPATNYSNLVDTFIQDTLRYLEGVYFFTMGGPGGNETLTAVWNTT